jgi:cytochrome c oxidase subunit 4
MKDATITTYFRVWLALLLLLGATVALAHLDLGKANAAVALLIAAAKAALVLAFFMELRRADVATRSTAAAGFLLLAVLVALTFTDYGTRP